MEDVVHRYLHQAQNRQAVQVPSNASEKFRHESLRIN